MSEPAGVRVARLEGLVGRGAESLAVRAGGLVFTGALDGGVIGRPVSETDMVLDAVEQVLAAAGCGPGEVGKTKLFLSAIEGAAPARARVASRLPAAAITAVGARLPDPQACIAIEGIALADGTPEPFRDQRDAVVATRMGSLLFTAGCASFDEGRLVGAGDLDHQGRVALGNVCAALGRAGARPDLLVKVNNTTACWHDYRLYNEAYNAVLAGSNAARCSVGGALRDPLALIEVEAVAALDGDLRFVDSTRSGVGRESFVQRSDTAYRPDLGPCKGPHSHGARAGTVVFVAGECPYDAEDRLVGPGDIAAQTLCTLHNVRIALEALGADLADVVKTSVTLSDARLVPGFEAAYRSVFAAPYPARSLVATALGQYGILVEIEAIAIVGAGRDRMAVVGRESLA